MSKIRNGLARSLTVGAAIATAALWSLPAAQATEGMFANGTSARHKALAGAGAADAGDASVQAINPAAITTLKSNHFEIGVSLFSPRRGFTGSGQPGLTPTGEFTSQSDYFYIPNISWSHRINTPLIDVLGLSIYGNGGMNTNYAASDGSGATQTPSCAGFAFLGLAPGNGVFCDNQAGINYEQAFIQATLAKQFGAVSVGVSPIATRTAISIRGLQAFDAVGTSIYGRNSGTMSNQGEDVAWGFGAKVGVHVALAPNFRLGLAYTSKIYMAKFDRYRGLFADQGDLDIPAQFQAGIAWDLMPTLTVMLDYRHIFYSDVAAIGNNSTAINAGNPFGSSNGPGFGWSDVDVIKVGLEWEATPDLTLRAGYSYNTSPLLNDTVQDAMFNILAPATVQHHITGGAKLQLTPGMAFELAGMYAPAATATGTELANFGNTSHTIELNMHQWELTAGLAFKY